MAARPRKGRLVTRRLPTISTHTISLPLLRQMVRVIKTIRGVAEENHGDRPVPLWQPAPPSDTVRHAARPASTASATPTRPTCCGPEETHEH